MIAILLSTYNGGNYLAEQLESLLLQTYTDFKVYIRDDGSTDSTLSIIESYTEDHTELIFHIKDEKKRIGASESFMTLLRLIEADYYMFCDQDDVWIPQKIDISMKALKLQEVLSKENSILIHTNLIIADENLNFNNKTLWDNKNVNPFMISQKYLKIVNYITGCTMLFNRKTRELAIKKNESVIMHDFFLALCVDYDGGKIISLDIPTIFYRQHSNNVIGAPKKLSLSRSLSFKMKNLFNYKLYHMISDIYKIGIIEFYFIRLRFFLKRKLS